MIGCKGAVCSARRDAALYERALFPSATLLHQIRLADRDGGMRGNLSMVIDRRIALTGAHCTASLSGEENLKSNRHSNLIYIRNPPSLLKQPDSKTQIKILTSSCFKLPFTMFVKYIGLVAVAPYALGCLHIDGNTYVGLEILGHITVTDNGVQVCDGDLKKGDNDLRTYSIYKRTAYSNRLTSLHRWLLPKLRLVGQSHYRTLANDVCQQWQLAVRLYILLGAVVWYHC